MDALSNTVFKTFHHKNSINALFWLVQSNSSFLLNSSSISFMKLSRDHAPKAPLFCLFLLFDVSCFSTALFSIIF